MPLPAVAVPLIAEAAGQGMNALFSWLGGRKKKGRLPQYPEYAWDLPPEAMALLEQLDVRSLDAITRQSQVGAGQRVRSLAARGIYDAPTTTAAGASVFGLAAPLKAGVLSERAGRQMGMIENLNAFKQARFGGQMQRAGAMNEIPGPYDIMGSLFGQMGSTVGTAIMAGEQEKTRAAEQERLYSLLERLLGRSRGSTMDWEQDYGTR